ncbi:MAG: lysophospholipase L1-like esterase [Mycobacterium sp.]|jgi:lysophospholipase L1-like esterase|nr:lysophospholipase L1-like esterase [Mycobacterium sp.]
MAHITKYVALGDSFTEGIGDPNPASRNGIRGWADRVAAHLAGQSPGFQYANLAVRGHTMDRVLTRQIERAVSLNPDLITICAGFNDLMKMRTDLDVMMAAYAVALRQLRGSRALVLTFTAADIGTVPVFRRLRGRVAIYNELLRAAADELGVRIVDFWRFPEYREQRLWASDRVHLSPLGHQQMAGRVLDALDVPHSLYAGSPNDPPPLEGTPVGGLRADVSWATRHAAPWFVRRARRMTPGAGIEPKFDTLTSMT